MEDHLKGLKTGNQCRQSGEMQEPELMVNWVISTKKKKKCNTHKRFEKKGKSVVIQVAKKGMNTIYQICRKKKLEELATLNHMFAQRQNS